VSRGSVPSTLEESFIGTDPESVAELAAAPKQGPSPRKVAPSQSPPTSLAANSAPSSRDSDTGGISNESNRTSATVVAGAARKSVWSSPSSSPWNHSNGTGKVAPSQEGLLNLPTGLQSNLPASSGAYSAPSSRDSVPGSTSDESNRSSATVAVAAANSSVSSSSGGGEQRHWNRRVGRREFS
jgi:hypothetical protein